jgi:hypothetical protein
VVIQVVDHLTREEVAPKVGFKDQTVLWEIAAWFSTVRMQRRVHQNVSVLV